MEYGHLAGATVHGVNGSDGLEHDIEGVSSRDARRPGLEPPSSPLESVLGMTALAIGQSEDPVVIGVRGRDHDVPGAEALKESTFHYGKSVWMKVLERLHGDSDIEPAVRATHGGQTALTERDPRVQPPRPPTEPAVCRCERSWTPVQAHDALKSRELEQLFDQGPRSAPQIHDRACSSIPQKCDDGVEALVVERSGTSRQLLFDAAGTEHRANLTAGEEPNLPTEIQSSNR